MKVSPVILVMFREAFLVSSEKNTYLRWRGNLLAG